MQDDISPKHILQIGFGFWASKTLLSDVELAVFSELAEGQKSGPELQACLGLHPRATYDFLDTLVALGLLQRAVLIAIEKLVPHGEWLGRAADVALLLGGTARVFAWSC